MEITVVQVKYDIINPYVSCTLKWAYLKKDCTRKCAMGKNRKLSKKINLFYNDREAVFSYEA